LGGVEMPGRDGTGPAGSGGRGGRGRGLGAGRMRGPASAGPGGFCECPKCGTKAAHQIATPCINMKCPQCGSAMVRA